MSTEISQKSKIFCRISDLYSDNMRVNGLTISEMANILKLKPDTVKMRLHVAGIKPITKEAVYDNFALEAIRNVPGKGRPSKPKQEKE
jgi:hypothetical protein